MSQQFHTGSQETIARRPTVQQAPSSHQSRLELRIKHGLFESGYFALQSIQVSVGKKTVVLSGEVETYFLKQLAGSVASVAAGDSRIENTISVI